MARSIATFLFLAVLMILIRVDVRCDIDNSLFTIPSFLRFLRHIFPKHDGIRQRHVVGVTNTPKSMSELLGSGFHDCILSRNNGCQTPIAGTPCL